MSNITKIEFDYLTELRLNQVFYGLPKIHESKEINDACFISNDNNVDIDAPENLTLRPTIAGPVCETHILNKYYSCIQNM